MEPSSTEDKLLHLRSVAQNILDNLSCYVANGNQPTHVQATFLLMEIKLRLSIALSQTKPQ